MLKKLVFLTMLLVVILGSVKIKGYWIVNSRDETTGTIHATYRKINSWQYIFFFLHDRFLKSNKDNPCSDELTYELTLR